MRHRRRLGFDLVREAWAALAMSWGRTAASLISVSIAVAGFVTVLGLSSTLSGTVSDTFDAVRATEVIVNDSERPVNSDADSQQCGDFDIDNLGTLAGVENSGLIGLSDQNPVSGSRSYTSQQTAVAALDPGSLAAVGPQLVDGRLFDAGAYQRGDDVAVIPAALAERLQVSGVGDSIVVAGRSMWVLGIFDDVVRRPELLNAVLIPANAQERVEGLNPMTCRAIIQTQSGAAQQVGAQAALALRPGQPDTLSVVVPPDPKQFRADLERPVQTTALLMSGAILVLGILSIAFAASASVAARTSEFGLRQSLGATPAAIAAQVVMENVLLAFVGGLIGAYIGALAVVVVSLINHWAPLLDVPLSAGITAACGLLGGIAGLPPALRAAHLNPVEALRQ